MDYYFGFLDKHLAKEKKLVKKKKVESETELTPERFYNKYKNEIVKIGELVKTKKIITLPNGETTYSDVDKPAFYDAILRDAIKIRGYEKFDREKFKQLNVKAGSVSPAKELELQYQRLVALFSSKSFNANGFDVYSEQIMKRIEALKEMIESKKTGVKREGIVVKRFKEYPELHNVSQFKDKPLTTDIVDKYYEITKDLPSGSSAIINLSREDIKLSNSLNDFRKRLSRMKESIAKDRSKGKSDSEINADIIAQFAKRKTK